MRVARKRFVTLLLLALVVLATGCGGEEGDGDEPQSTLEAAQPTAVATPTPVEVSSGAEEPDSAESDAINVWMANQFLALNNTAASAVLEELIGNFQSTHPDLNLHIEGKNTSGPGGILSYLQAGSVAPSILPDLVIISSDNLEHAVDRGIVYPLDELLEQEMIDDLFPAALSMGEVNGTLFGFPFIFSDMHHLVYDSQVLSGDFPDMWDDLLETEDATLAFPASGSAGAEMVLQFYLAGGGSLVDDANQPTLEVEPLTQALGQFNRGTARRVILRESASMVSVEEAWDKLLDEETVIAQHEASAFLREKEEFEDGLPARVPGYESAMRPFVNGWVWAITAADPERQQLAAELLSTISSSNGVGDWTLAAGQLPARRSAYTRWPVNDEVTQFFLQASEHAHEFPEQATPDIMEALSNAVVQMINLAKSPRSAAEEASQAVRG